MTPLRKIKPNLLSIGLPRKLTQYASLDAEIQGIRSIDLASVTFAALEAALEAFVSGYVTRLMFGKIGVAYRARRIANNKLWQSLSDLWAPPAEFAALGRFNQEGDPLLYTASRPATAILEMRPKPRESFVLLVLRGDWLGPLVPVMPLGIQRSAGTKLGWSAFGDARHGLSTAPEVKAWVKKWRIESSWTAQDEFLSEIATANYDGPAQPAGYQMTNGIARRMKTAPNSMGLLYPSVASNYYGFNNAFYLETVSNILTPYEAWHVSLGDRIDPPGGIGARTFEGMVTRRGTINGDEIRWGSECWISVDGLHSLTRPQFIPAGAGKYNLVRPII